MVLLRNRLSWCVAVMVCVGVMMAFQEQGLAGAVEISVVTADHLHLLAGECAEKFEAKSGCRVRIEPMDNLKPRADMETTAGKVDAFLVNEMGLDEDTLVGFKTRALGEDGLVFIVNSANPFLKELAGKKIDKALLRSLWTGGCSWEALSGGLGATTVKPYIQSGNSLNTAVARLFEFDPVGLKGETKYSDGELYQTVAKDPNGIGYVSLKFARKLALAKDKLSAMPHADGQCAVPVALVAAAEGVTVVSLPTGEPQKAFSELLERRLYQPFKILLLSREGANPGPLDDFAKFVTDSGQIRFADFGYADLAKKVIAKPDAGAPPRFVYAESMHCFVLGGIPAGFIGSPGSRNALPTIDPGNFDAWPQTEQTMRAWWSSRLALLAKSGKLKDVRLDLDLAEQAGLDALAYLINESHLTASNQWRPGFLKLIRAAATHQVKIIPDLWESVDPQGSPAERRQGLRYLSTRVKELMDSSPDSFFRYEGKPVINLGEPMRYGLENKLKFGCWDYADFAPFFEAWGGRDKVFLSVNLGSFDDSGKCGWLDGTDLCSTWFVSIGWGDKVVENLMLPLTKLGKKRSWPVTLGKYTTVGEAGRNQMGEGLGVSRFCDQWRQAIANGAQAVSVQTWNDFSEDHQITESNYRGDTIILLTKYFSDWFKRGTPLAITDERIFLFHRRQLLGAKLEGPYRSSSPDWQSTPVTDYVQVVTMLKTPGALKLKLGDAEFTLPTVPAGLHEWLVYVPKTKDYHGNKPAWNAGSYDHPFPENAAWRDVATIPALPACRPEAALLRDGAPILKVVSRTGLAGAAKFEDLCVVGSRSE